MSWAPSNMSRAAAEVIASHIRQLFGLTTEIALSFPAALFPSLPDVCELWVRPSREGEFESMEGWETAGQTAPRRSLTWSANVCRERRPPRFHFYPPAT